MAEDYDDRLWGGGGRGVAGMTKKTGAISGTPAPGGYWENG